MKTLFNKVIGFFSFEKSRLASVNRNLSYCGSIGEVESRLRQMESNRTMG